MATIVNIKSVNMNSGHMQQNQLTRSLERILEDAHLSGELKLSGRKLKDFPKAAGKYNLNDTVIADLSRNRFCELPEDVTSFPFLETLLMYHNTLRSIPDTIRGLYSLSYLDLRSNQLSVLPREICLLPLQVLLVSNNRLVSLPEELGRMDNLTELDAACNQITHLPTRISDLKSLKSLSLRNNQLVYLPRELKSLQLVFLDISCNRIATLPVELRLMTSLVTLELENNPLTSPPASLCVRGLVHVFKYLDTMATKEEKTRTGGTFDGHTTLRRALATPKHYNTIDSQKLRRHHIDSGYSTCDGLDKNWSQEISQNHDNIVKIPQSPLHINTEINQIVQSSSSTPCVSPGNIAGGYDNSTLEEELKRSTTPIDQIQKRIFQSDSQNNSNDVSPDGDFASDSLKSEEKSKLLGNIQTYREYKEALRQQRNQDSSSIYRPKEQATTPNGNDSKIESVSIYKSKSLSPTVYSSNQSSPKSPHNPKLTNTDPMLPHQNGQISTDANTYYNHNKDSINNSNCSTIPNKTDDIPISNIKKPVQKVTPSRNTNVAYRHSSHSTINGNHKTIDNTTSAGNKEYSVYVKPNSPTNASAGNGYSKVPSPSQCINNKGGTNKTLPKQNRSVSWNQDIPAEKLSFTMRREFDKQKEETELIEQLRIIIESRLKMLLPKNVASALTDGVVLCHLANHVRPRSVGSIHVPSPAVPKLTMARCRRNVDNFLNACRSIGVDENLMCCAADVLEGKGVVQVAITVCELLRFHSQTIRSPTKAIGKINGSPAIA